MCKDSMNSDRFDICFLSLSDLISLQTYDDFEQIIKYLLNQYNVEIEKKLEDPDIRISYLTINYKAFKLYNGP